MRAGQAGREGAAVPVRVQTVPLPLVPTTSAELSHEGGMCREWHAPFPLNVRLHAAGAPARTW